MEKGYFYFENLELLIKMAEDAGIYVPDSIKEPKNYIKRIKKSLCLLMMLKVLNKKCLMLIKKLIGDLVEIARKKYW